MSNYSVKVSPGIFDLYETGYRDITAITASIATKLVSAGDAVASIAVEPQKKKLKIDSTIAFPHDFIELLSIIGSVTSRK
jgi:hypothetical protein